MAVSDGYRTFVVEQLADCVPDVRTRRMFGGVGIYSGERFFAVISSDTLYFKVDDETRPDYLAAGSIPFQPYGDERSMGYFSVPAEVLEDRDQLAAWSDAALGVARRAAESVRRKK